MPASALSCSSVALLRSTRSVAGAASVLVVVDFGVVVVAGASAFLAWANAPAGANSTVNSASRTSRASLIGSLRLVTSTPPAPGGGKREHQQRERARRGR